MGGRSPQWGAAKTLRQHYAYDVGMIDFLCYVIYNC
jgi:hypothetical protein